MDANKLKKHIKDIGDNSNSLELVLSALLNKELNLKDRKTLEQLLQKQDIIENKLDNLGL